MKCNNIYHVQCIVQARIESTNHGKHFINIQIKYTLIVNTVL